jgi:hypothetical protein
MARTKLSLLKKAADKKRRQGVRLRFKNGIKKVINFQRFTVGKFMSRTRVKKPCGCIVSRPGTLLPYTPRSDGMFGSFSGCGYCPKHLKEFLKAQ